MIETRKSIVARQVRAGTYRETPAAIRAVVDGLLRDLELVPDTADDGEEVGDDDR